MSYDEIKKVESELMFKRFLLRIGFHNFQEYFKLFGMDLKKRATAVERYLDVYNKKSGK